MQKNAGSKHPKVQKASKGRVILWKCAVRDNEKLRFIKNQESCGLLSSLGTKLLSIKFYHVQIFYFKRENIC